jgi:glutamate racemase
MKGTGSGDQGAGIKRPVGFFDSGVGGTCILNAFKKLCPDEETIYIADSKNCPYGNKPAEEIIRLSLKKLMKY